MGHFAEPIMSVDRASDPDQKEAPVEAI